MTKEDIKYLKSIGLTPNDVEIYQDGGVTQQTTQSKPNQQEQIMQIIQMYAQLTQVKPEQIVKQLQSAKPQDQQKMIQQMVMQIQEYEKQNSGQDEQEIVNNPQEEIQEPQMKCGGKTKKKMYENGGLQNYYKSESGNVEAENNEHVLTPDGKSFELNGKTHSEGGIDLNLPSQSLIFSEKIKAPKEVIAKILNKEVDKLTKSEKKYSFADIANKYSTEKDFEKIKNVKDDYSKKAIELNITKKLPKLQEIFESQERYKFGLGMENDYEKIMMSKQENQNPNQFPEEQQMSEYGGKIYAQNGKITPRYIGLENNYPLISKNPFLEKLNEINKQSKNKSGYYGNVNSLDPLKFALPNYSYTDPINYQNWQNEYNSQYVNGRNILNIINPQLAEQLPSNIFNNNDSYTLNDIDNKNGNFTSTRNRYGIPLDTYQGQNINLNDIDENFYKEYIQPYYPNLTLDQIKKSSNFYFKGNDSPIINPSTNNTQTNTNNEVTNNQNENPEITNKYDQLKSTILDYNPIINANKKATLNNLLGNINEVNYPIMLRRPPLRSLNEGYDLAKMNNIALNKNYADSVYQTANSGLSEVDKQAINSKNYAENLKASYNNIPNTTKYFNDIQNSNRDVTFTNESNQYNYDMQVLPRYEQQLGNVQKGLYQSKKENMDTINKYHNFNADFKMRMNDQQMINDLIDNGDGTYTYTPNKKFIIKNQADMQFLQFLYKVPESQRSQMIEYYKLTQWNNNFY